MADSGFQEATTADNGSFGQNFSNRDNILTNSSTYAGIGADSVADTDCELSGFDFSAVTGGVAGIALRATLADSIPDGGLVYGVRLSWDGGTSWTHTQAAPRRIPPTGTVNTKTTYTVGGSTDTWGRSWSLSELATDKFKVSFFMDDSESDTYTSECQAYLIDVQVYDSGGGGAASPRNLLLLGVG